MEIVKLDTSVWDFQAENNVQHAFMFYKKKVEKQLLSLLWHRNCDPITDVRTQRTEPHPINFCQLIKRQESSVAKKATVKNNLISVGDKA